VSQENVEIVQRGFAAMKRGDTEAVLAEMAPAIEWYPTADFVDIGPFRGYNGIRELMNLLLSTFDAYTLEPEDLIDAGDKVVVPVRQTGRGKGSELAVDARYILVFTLREGKSVRVESYYDEREALKAVGLEE
jgi:ketosteroid isomerase-like protein